MYVYIYIHVGHADLIYTLFDSAVKCAMKTYISIYRIPCINLRCSDLLSLENTYKSLGQKMHAMPCYNITAKSRMFLKPLQLHIYVEYYISRNRNTYIYKYIYIEREPFYNRSLQDSKLGIYTIPHSICLDPILLTIRAHATLSGSC